MFSFIVLFLLLTTKSSIRDLMRCLFCFRTRLLMSSVLVLILALWWKYQENEQIQTFHTFVNDRLLKVLTDRIASFTAGLRQLISRRSENF